MTDSELNKLADLIVQKLLKRQADYDAEFLKIMMEKEDPPEVGFMSKPVKTNEEIVALHLDRVESLLEKYIAEEKYEDASRIQKEIDRIKKDF